jgi:phosphate-selective porin OprO/OprP
VAATTGKQDGALPTYKSGGQLTFFSYATGVSAAGTRTRLSPQASWSYKRIGLFGEWARSRQEVRRSAASPLVRVEHRAWQAALAIVLTGEDATPGAVKPRSVFEPGKGTGALELALRVNGFDADEDAFALGLADPAKAARKARAWGLGLNWYLSRHLKQSVDYERTKFTGGAAASGDRTTENALFIRSQVSF